MAPVRHCTGSRAGEGGEGGGEGEKTTAICQQNQRITQLANFLPTLLPAYLKVLL